MAAKDDDWLAKDDPLARERRTAMEALKLDFDARTIPPGAMGLALSGGGIRSATISLGFVQALARRRRLLDFDYLSTVSGGGYFGSFLRSLFVPDDRRGITGKGTPLPPLSPSATQHFVEEVLSLDARRETLDDPFDPETDPLKPRSQIRNPIWWLREHGRYLAPNGPTDYGYAVSYLVRNWVALLYTFTIAASLLSLLLFFFDLGAWTLLPGLLVHISPARSAIGGLVPSPVFALPVLLGFLTLATGLAYWLTVSLAIGNRWSDEADAATPPSSVPQFWRHWLFLLALAAVAAAMLKFVVARLLPGVGIEFLLFWRGAWPWRLIAFGVLLAAAALLIAAPVALSTAQGESGDDFTNELRRRLTKLGADFSIAAAATFGIAVIDTLALVLSGPVIHWIGLKGVSGVIGVIVPAGAWLIGKAPQWFRGGWIARTLGKHVWIFALVAGVLLFGGVGVLADAMVQSIAWTEGPYPADVTALVPPAWAALLPAAVVIVGLCLTTGWITGFINMSSLHSIYSGRLTRAFLGASNIARLRLAAKPDGPAITENHPRDYIDVSRYQEEASAAPIHLINVTLNETRSRSRSQILDRDRKGMPVVFDPKGIWVDAGRNRKDAFYSWDALKKVGAESLSVGQLCAISGAAASAGMGARTTLGGALAFSFANIRLGYWWRLNDLLPQATLGDDQRWLRFQSWASRPIRTYYYLWTEMTASYTRRNWRVYLSDGGHFEDSGVYELLRRKVPAIVVCDNAADPDMEFEDLENLVRKARIDLGLAVVAARRETVEELFGAECAPRFLNGGARDWRKVARKPGGTAFALLLDVYDVRPSSRRADNYYEQVHRGRILWLKPRLFDGLPPDAAAYGLRNAPFPQQTTGDQFFDEAQWESYRALGYTMAEALFGAAKDDIDAFRALMRPPTKPQPNPPVVTATR